VSSSPASDPGPQAQPAGPLPAAFVYAPALAEAELSPDHPLKPARARACYDLLTSEGAFEGDRAAVFPFRPADVADVLRVHDPAYVEMVRRLSDPQTARQVRPEEAARYGFSAHGDNPPFAGMYEYYLLVCGAAIEAIRLVDEGQTAVSFMPAGGVNHHAMHDRASGFGVFNDVAVALAWLRARGRRVMYLDLDVHQGDGVEAAFAADERVLTVSLHESTRYLFPGPKGGFPENTGSGAGVGYAVNVALAPYTGDETWLWAFEQIVPPLYRAFAPELLVVQLGADGYYADPLAHLLLTTEAYETAAARLADLTGGRLATVGGGGYDLEATPRIWALEFAALAGVPLPDDLRDPPGSAPVPDAALAALVRRQAGETVATIKRLVFPVHGLAD
jgi:acetoin utilization protein AcuC